MDIQIEKCLTTIRKSMQKYSQAKANRVYLEEFRKSKIAILKNQCESETGIKTDCGKDDWARAHPEYLELLEGLREAIQEEEYLKHLIKGCETKIDLYRTEQANQRFERKSYGN